MKRLKEAGFVVEHAGDGEQGLIWCKTQTFDVIVADLMLPKLDGLAMIGELEKNQSC